MAKNYGLNWELEKEQQSEKDWIFGAKSLTCIAEISPEERIDYLPKGEVQRSNKGDMADCCSRGPINILETKFNWLCKKELLSGGSIKFLKENGFINNGQVEISDAYISIKSGTTPIGNSMKAPLEAIRKYGIVPKKLLPLGSWMTWNDYHNPTRITEEIERIANESLKYFGFNYEKVWSSHTDEMLNRDILDTCGFAWPEPINGEYPRVDTFPNHVFIKLKNPRTYIFDNYIDHVDGDFIKKLTPDYKFGSYDYRIIISKKLTPEEKEEAYKKIEQSLNRIQKLINWIREEIKKLKNSLGKMFYGK